MQHGVSRSFYAGKDTLGLELGVSGEGVGGGKGGGSSNAEGIVGMFGSVYARLSNRDQPRLAQL